MLRREEESEAEVRREDQENINRFAQFNARLHELRSEKTLLQRTLEGMDDASTEIMMGSGDPVMLMMGGETFFETSEEAATEYCEKQMEELQAQLDKLQTEETEIMEEQATLKKILYGRFGTSIQLEEDK